MDLTEVLHARSQKLKPQPVAKELLTLATTSNQCHVFPSPHASQ